MNNLGLHLGQPIMEAIYARVLSRHSRTYGRDRYSRGGEHRNLTENTWQTIADLTRPTYFSFKSKTTSYQYTRDDKVLQRADRMRFVSVTTYTFSPPGATRSHHNALRARLQVHGRVSGQRARTRVMMSPSIENTLTASMCGSTRDCSTAVLSIKRVSYFNCLMSSAYSSWALRNSGNVKEV